MQQRTGRGEHQITLRRQRLQTIKQRGQIGAPDIAPVHYAEREQAVLRHRLHHRIQLLRRARQIDVQAGDRQGRGERQVIFQTSEIGGQHDLRPRSSQLGISAGKRAALPIGKVCNEDGFIDLHPFSACFLEPREHSGIKRKNLFEQVERIASVLFCKAQPGYRTKNDRTRFKTLRLGFEIVLQRLDVPELQPGFRLDLGDNEMIVGVEPFGHLASGHAAMRVAASRTAGRTACHRKIGFEPGCLAAGEAIACRNGAEHHACVEHMVVQREIV